MGTQSKKLIQAAKVKIPTEYQGQWIIIYGKHILCHGNELSPMIDQVRATHGKKVNDMLIKRVPKSDTHPVGDVN